jgi:N utilization substance protein B
MATRRHAREWAVQFLFQLDMNPPENIDTALALFLSEKPNDAKARAFASELVLGVRDGISDIDAILIRHATHWDIGRMSTLDRNILRMGIYELKAHKDVPPPVVINEAVDIAKFF